MKKGHTIVELLVAMGLLAAILVVSGAVFQQAIGAHRTAKATSEVSQKLRMVTQQLDSDFKGLRKDAPFMVYFVRGGGDQIQFFADGDFGAYTITDRSNLARIYYGAANVFGVRPKPTLARRQHIYIPTVDHLPPVFLPTAGLVFPDITNTASLENSLLVDNNRLEYDTLTLGHWKAICGFTVSNDAIVRSCFGVNGRAVIDTESLTGTSIGMLMCQGLSGFKVQFAYMTFGAARWWPMGSDYNEPSLPFPAPNELGFSANMAGGVTDWISGAIPNAIKFTFTLYDSAGVFKDGKTFTHIVYLDN